METKEQICEKIKNASPLELATVLQEVELYDKKDTRKIVDEIYAEFQTGDHLKEKVLIPVFTSVIDGFLESSSTTRKLRQKGLTATRIVQECRQFTYETPGKMQAIPDGYTEWKNIRETTRSDFDEYAKNSRQEYNRGKFEDRSLLDDYKERAFANNGGRINARDEYTGDRNVYKDAAHPDSRRSVIKYKHDHRAEVDHIVPLKQIHERYKGNYALTDDDIKQIANADSNYALTSARINRGAGAPGAGGKFDKTNSEFVADQRRREQEGRPNLGVSEEAKENMLQMEKDSSEQLDKDANKAIAANLTGRGSGDTGKILGKTASNALSQSKDYMIGNVIMYLLKPLYYEISDIFDNGLKEGVNAESTSQAFKIRFGRVKKYVCENAKSFLGNSAWDFVKGFVSSLVEGIISLFLGVFKQVLKLIKEGIKILIQSGKILFGKETANMSAAEKGDAIIKLIGAGVISICGIGLESLMNQIGIMEPWSVVLSTMLTGIASALFMYLLDQMDLFSVKSEKRYARIEEIFDERIKDIQEARDAYNTAALEAMRNHHIQFQGIMQTINGGLQSNNIDIINEGVDKLASFMKVDLPYKNTDEFCDFMDNDETLEL